jgi:hypothetical protein
MSKKYQSILSLMLKGSDYEVALHGKEIIGSIKEAYHLCDALEAVVSKWSIGTGAFGIMCEKEVTSSAFGSIALVRMLFHDLAQKTPQVGVLESEKILSNLVLSFLPLGLVYGKMPSLAEWYLTLPQRVILAYEDLRSYRHA